MLQSVTVTPMGEYNVEITTTVMLTFGLDSDQVREYRESELEQAKDLVQSGRSVHIMDFEQIILTEVESIDDSYSDTYTDTFRVYRYSEEDIINDIFEFSDLPTDLKYAISDYYGVYLLGSEVMLNQYQYQ